MYYTVRNTTRRGYHKENDEGDFLRVDARKATQFATWIKATARALELNLTYPEEHYTVEVHDWPGGNQ